MNRQWHHRNRNKALLDPDDVEHIKQLYAVNGLSTREIARRMQIGQTTVLKALTGTRPYHEMGEPVEMRQKSTGKAVA